jgi:hypothetical protein
VPERFNDAISQPECERDTGRDHQTGNQQSAIEPKLGTPAAASDLAAIAR